MKKLNIIYEKIVKYIHDNKIFEFDNSLNKKFEDLLKENFVTNGENELNFYPQMLIYIESLYINKVFFKNVEKDNFFNTVKKIIYLKTKKKLIYKNQIIDKWIINLVNIENIPVDIQDDIEISLYQIFKMINQFHASENIFEANKNMFLDITTFIEEVKASNKKIDSKDFFGLMTTITIYFYYNFKKPENDNQEYDFLLISLFDLISFKIFEKNKCFVWMLYIYKNVNLIREIKKQIAVENKVNNYLTVIKLCYLLYSNSLKESLELKNTMINFLAKTYNYMWSVIYNVTNEQKHLGVKCDKNEFYATFFKHYFFDHGDMELLFRIPSYYVGKIFKHLQKSEFLDKVTWSEHNIYFIFWWIKKFMNEISINPNANEIAKKISISWQKFESKKS